MTDNHYGWFERVSAGIYALSPKGVTATSEYLSELENLRAAASGADNISVIAKP